MTGYALLGEAVTRETLGEDQLQDLTTAAAEETEGDLPSLVRYAYRAGAAAALYLADNRLDDLSAAFGRLLDLP